MNDFLRGLGAPLRAAHLLMGTPRLRKLAMLPLIVNIVLFVIGVPLTIWFAVDRIGAMLPTGGMWDQGLRVMLQALAAIAIVFGSLFTFVIIGNIIAAPFNSLLSEAIEEHRTGRPAANTVGAVRSAARGVLTAISRLFIFLLFYPPIFATQFIPVAGIFIHPILGALYGSFVLSIDFSDPTFERHIDRFRDKVRFIWNRKALYLGFGLTAVAMAIIPVVNFLLLPLGVAAATILYLEEREKVGSS